MAGEPIVKIKNLSVIYFLGRSNQVNALTEANLEIYPGEFVIFFGPSGCGKSTLLYSIAGLERNIQGDIFINGKNLSKFKHTELDHHRQKVIGMIFQAYYLINSLTVLGNTILPQFPLGIKKKEREKRGMELLKFFGVQEQAGKFPNELSGGQQQRAAICRSLMNNPQMILADEPTGNLDSKSATDVMNLLSKLNEEQGKTIVLVTHSPGSLDYAHRVFYMKDGRIIDTKVNRELSAKLNKEQLAKDPLAKDLEAGQGRTGAATGGSQVSRSLELLARTYSNFSQDQLGGLLIPFKAKQIVSEVLTDMSNREIETLENEVENILKNILSKEGFVKFLDQGLDHSGLGLDKRTAKKMADKIYEIILEIRKLEEQEKKIHQGLIKNDDSEVGDIRRHLFEAFDVKIHNNLQLERINSLIKQRISNKIDGKQFAVGLDQPLAKGGANLNNHLVRKLARRLELLILGKFK